MKAEFQFNLPEENTEFQIHAQAQTLYYFVWEWVRNTWCHYEDNEKLYPLFQSDDWQYMTDKNGKALTHDTPINDISPYTMIELMNNKFYRMLKEEDISLEI